MSDAEHTDTDGTAPDDEAILAVLREAERSPLPTTEVASRLDASPKATRERLEALVEAGELERRDVEHRTWWRLPGRSAEPSDEAIAAVESSGGLVATGIDPDEADDSPAAGAVPATQESFWSGVEWSVDVDVDSRALAAVAVVALLVLAVLWRRR